MRCFVSIVKKAPILGAFFIALALVACADQRHDTDRELHSLDYIADGDTIVIGDNTKVRLVGINTPELGYGDRQQEPLAKQAKDQLKAFLGKGGVQLQYDMERQDSHGRVLAHVFSANGENAQIMLLTQGLAFAVAVGENQTFLKRYLEAEANARQKNLGVWGDDHFRPRKAIDVARDRAKGYRRVEGKVTKISTSNKHHTLHLGEKFRVLIPKQYWKKHFKGKPKQFQGKHIIARGWVFNTNSISGVKIYHPSMIE